MKFALLLLCATSTHAVSIGKRHHHRRPIDHHDSRDKELGDFLDDKGHEAITNAYIDSIVSGIGKDLSGQPRQKEKEFDCSDDEQPSPPGARPKAGSQKAAKKLKKGEVEISPIDENGSQTIRHGKHITVKLPEYRVPHSKPLVEGPGLIHNTWVKTLAEKEDDDDRDDWNTSSEDEYGVHPAIEEEKEPKRKLLRWKYYRKFGSLGRKHWHDLGLNPDKLARELKNKERLNKILDPFEVHEDLEGDGEDDHANEFIK